MTYMYYVNSLPMIFTLKMTLDLSNPWQTRQSSSQRSLHDKGHLFFDFFQSTNLISFKTSQKPLRILSVLIKSQWFFLRILDLNYLQNLQKPHPKGENISYAYGRCKTIFKLRKCNNLFSNHNVHQTIFIKYYCKIILTSYENKGA